MKFRWNVLLTLLALVLCASPLFAQKYPMPGKKNQTAVKCIGCGGSNEGKPTYPYNDPLMAHVGRWVDSTSTINIQNYGIRTVRAYQVRVSPDNQRLYMMLGEAVGGYNLAKFFSTTLKQPMVVVDALPTNGYFQGRPGSEKVQKVDSLFYAESPLSGWTTSLIDSQKHLWDYDSDDRGYVYVATVYFGWGIAKDNGGGEHMGYVANIRDASPGTIFGIKSGGRYYVVPSEPKEGEAYADIYEFTAPSTVTKQASRRGTASGVMEWAKLESAQRLAVLNSDGHVRVYDYAAYIAGNAPLANVTPPTGRRFTDVSIDESGRVWISESGAPNNMNVIRRLMPSGGGYTEEPLDVYGGAFDPSAIHAAAGYVAVIGRNSAGKSLTLLKVEGNSLRALDIDDFFRKYYDVLAVPTGYAAPDWKYTSPFDVTIVPNAGKVYLLASFGGLGDVFEIQAGESLSVSGPDAPFGTTNPNAPANTSGTPFYGDVLKFRATSNSPSANYSANWDFGNPESGLTGNLASSALGALVSHQYTGLTTPGTITTPKVVKAAASTDSAIFGTTSISLAVPTARMLVPGVTSAMTPTARAPFEAVPGESFRDASDGVVEGHVSAWIIDGAETRKAPNEAMPVGNVLGSHTVTLESRYGKADSALNVANAYTSTVSSVAYQLKPFVATMAPATLVGNNYHFEATGRYTTDRQLLGATQWTVTWTATGGSASTVQASQTNTVNVGTIPPFDIPKSAAGNGTVVKLQVSVDAAAVPAPAYATYTAQQTLSIPDPLVQVVSGCANAGEVCSLQVVSKTPNTSTANWNVHWVISLGNSTVKEGDGLSIAFTPASAGTYTLTATELRFNIVDTLSKAVAASICGPVAEEYNAAISTDCLFDCKAGVEIQFDPNIKSAYKVQPCDTFTWDFGDNTATSNLRAPKHTYARNGSYHVTFTMKNNNNQRTWSKDITIGGTTPPPPPPQVCTTPVNPLITYSGSKGCATGGKQCTASETVTFFATRGGGGLQDCDVTTWTFDGTEQSTSRTPSKKFTAGNHVVSLSLGNTAGTANALDVQLSIAADAGACSTSAIPANLGIEYFGTESGCSQIDKTKPCKVNENIQFTLTSFGYTLQSCDTISWSFGDNGTGSGRNASHTYTTLAATRNVTVTVANPSNPNGASISVNLPFGNVPILTVPQLEFVGFQSSAAKGTTVTFTARVKNDVEATGWLWNFGDSLDSSQTSIVGKTVTISHTYGSTGTYPVTVRARHSQAASGAETGVATGTIVIDDTPEYKYLLPVVVSSPGQNNSTWRTDVQIYTPDSSVSASNKLSLSASLRDINRTLEITKSTTIYEDFMKTFNNGTDSGAVIITAKTRLAPQIWTRTYNQAANGTFGQFIPAIRIDAAGGGAAFGEGKYYLAGLRHDTRYRTNLGFLNPNMQAFAATVRVYDEAGLPIGTFNRTLQPFQLDQFPITAALPTLKGDHPFSVEVEVPAGQWLISYASFIDSASNDPVFVQAKRESELASTDFRTSVVPGVGHIGAWRSDVTIYNPNGRGIAVDVAYHDQSGAKVAEAHVPIGGGQFMQYDDLLRSGLFGTLTSESLGMLRVTATVSSDQRYPLAFARTYNDDGSGKTYGQGIDGFAEARANVKPTKAALIPGVRSNSKYYTNFGVTNVSNTDAVVTVKLLDPSTGAETPIQQHTIKANQSVVQRVELSQFENASLKVEVTGGNVWAFASIVDKGTLDPEYVAATPLQ